MESRVGRVDIKRCDIDAKKSTMAVKAIVGVWRVSMNGYRFRAT